MKLWTDDEVASAERGATHNHSLDELCTRACAEGRAMRERAAGTVRASHVASCANCGAPLPLGSFECVPCGAVLGTVDA